jgi:beta-lactamase class A
VFPAFFAVFLQAFSLFLRFMKKGAIFFNFLLALSIAGCRPAIKTMTTSTEMKEAKVFPRTDTFLTDLVKTHPEFFDTILKANSPWKVQFIYTRIDRKNNNKPTLTNYYYNVDPSRYYYPASTVKLPIALLALQKLNELNIAGLDKNTTMITEAGDESQTRVYNDPSAADGRPSVAQYVKKIFLVSDNDAFNRLYEFLGQEYINNSLHKMGYDSAQILHRLQLPLTEEQNRITNPVIFYNAAGKEIYRKPIERSNMVYQQRNTRLGNGYMSNDSIVNTPFDFSKRNRLNLIDLHSILTSVIFPAEVRADQRFRLTEDDYSFVRKYMSMKPAESQFPQYDSSYSDAYSKFLLFGGAGKMEDPAVRIFNKEGDAYGFLTDAAYVVDVANGVEFLLSATIYCNSDGIFNDDKYDYETVGLPFLKNLGRVVYEYELSRKRKNKPDLSEFIIDYSR